MPRPRGPARRLAVMTSAVLAVGGFAATPALAAPAGPDASVVGQMSALFEEGGKTPACFTGSDGRIACKPPAVSTFMLPNGKVLYWSGIESAENVKRDHVTELSDEDRNSPSRLLDLTSGTPKWSLPGNIDGNGTNPQIHPGRTEMGCLADPTGMAGVPGRPGDGLVGSAVGTVGGPQADYSCAPDDVQANDIDMFCADVSMLGNGAPLVIGGTDWYNEPEIMNRAHGAPTDLGILELEGTRAARTYDYQTNTWHGTAPMKFGRWYPGTVTLPNGNVLATGGTEKLIKSTQGSQVRRTETYNLATNKWEENFTGPASENTLPQNSRLFITPNGKVFFNGEGQMWGPFGQSVDEALFGLRQFFNLQTKQWEVVGATVPRSSPATTPLPMKAPYDKMTILSAGGTLGPDPGSYLATPLSTLTTVDKDGNVTEVPSAPLHHPRWFSSSVQLPDGKIMITNGADKDEVIFPGLESPVVTPEMYDPQTNTYTDMANLTHGRTYHNSTVLLPDGRVLIGGQSPIGFGYESFHTLVPGVTANNQKDPSFQIYSPPYLFQGARPHIDGVQSALKWGQSFSIDTKDAASIQKVYLMRTPSAQHVYDSDPRTLELPFSVQGNKLVAQTPQDGVAAPPGTYYLFIDKKGNDGKTLVPSVARMLHVGDYSNSSAAFEPMTDSTANAASIGHSDLPPNDFLSKPPSLGIDGVPDLPSPGSVPQAPALPQVPQAPLGGVQLPAVAPSAFGRRSAR